MGGGVGRACDDHSPPGALFVQVESERVKKQQQEWAAKFLKEKLDRINSQAVRSPKSLGIDRVGEGGSEKERETKIENETER